jgi:hypothetical protein
MANKEKIFIDSQQKTEFAKPVKIGKQALIVVISALTSIVVQTPAWATCADGSSFPNSPGGYVALNQPAFDPGVYTGTLGSVFVPDASVYEGGSTNGSPNGPLTGPDNRFTVDGMGNPVPLYQGHGHNWVMDQGSTLCKQIDNGVAGDNPTSSWTIPVTSITSACIFMPVVKGGKFTNFGTPPGQSDALTLPCDTSILGSANNTYKNQLGCLTVASRSVDGQPHNTSPENAPSFLFVSGIQGGLFNIPLVNDPNGGTGKVAVNQNYYSDIPEGQKLTNVAVSKQGEYVIATSVRRATFVYACHHPLGNPGDPTKPIDQATFNNFLATQNAGAAKCMQVGSNGLAVDLVTGFGPDDQPYFGGQRFMNSFGGTPGNILSPASWPKCITQGTPFTIDQAFTSHSANHCGTAQPNGAFNNSLIIQPSSFASHGNYIYTAANAGAVIQFKVTKNPNTGQSQYTSRTYVSGVPGITTGLGVADDLQSLMVYSDPSGIGAAGAEVVTKVPLCEDF